MAKYTILKDTREKKGWDFKASTVCKGTEAKALPTGDYTLIGYEELFIIERKGAVTEWAQNVLEDRFYRELDRLILFKEPYILLEFDMKDLYKYPASSGIPRSRWRYMKMKGPALLKKTIEIMREYYQINFIFCGDFGREVAMSIFKRVANVR